VEVRESELSFTEEALEELRKEIAEFMGISYSLGLADTKTLAKIASKKNKPSGSYYLQKDDEIDFLSKLSLSSLWGIGRRMTKTLTDLELITVGDLLRTSDSLLQKNFSIQLLRTKQELLGIKCYPIEENYAHQKGMQVTRSFARTEDIAFVLSELSTNAEEFCINLQKQNLEVESLEIWIKQVINGKDVHLSKTLLLEEATANHRTLLKAMNSTLSEIRKSKKGIMRGTGIYGKTVPKKRDQTSKLFTTTLDVDTTSILSSIRSNFGNGAIMTLGSMEATNKRRRERDKYDTQSLYLSGLPYPYLGEVR
jgi:DNA polymerase V